MSNEDLFYDTLEKVFTGAEVQGKGGFINLLATKHSYYKKVLQIFKEQIEKCNMAYDTREELFDRLYTFFKKYFSECGSVYYCQTAYSDKVYEKVYTNKKDVVLFYKTSMLYYVKSETLFQNMIVRVSDENGSKKIFAFDARNIQNKKSNEKKELVFTYDTFATPDFITNEDGSPFVEDAFILKVTYSESNTKTKLDGIARQMKISEDIVKKALDTFKKQSSVDYFINKDAKKFLTEQLDLYTHQILLNEKNEFSENRLKQLKAFKDFAKKIIDFISQFENELVKVWNKPKFPLASNYVITLDRLEKLSGDILQKVAADEGLKAQIKEWQDLGMVDSTFDFNKRSEKHKHLPLDTKYFKELETQILSQFDNLDEELDGRLIHSENYQALNTLKGRYKEKVQCVYIDPMFNTNSSPIFYMNSYKDASWMTLIENRMDFEKQLLKKDGISITAIDDTEVAELKLIKESFYDKENLIAIVTVRCTPQGRVADKQTKTTEFNLIYAKNINNINEVRTQKLGSTQLTNLRRGGMNSSREERPKRYYPILYKDSKLSMITDEEYSKIYVNNSFDDNYLENLIKNYEQKGFKVFLPITNGKKLVWQRMFERVKKEISTYVVEGENIKTPAFETEIINTLWDNEIFSNPIYGSKYLKEMLNMEVADRTPKSYLTIMQFLSIFENTGIYLDYFVGTGSTIEAVIRKNIEDDGDRKYLGIELSDTFDDVLIPRIKKVCYSDKWKEGKAQDGGSGASQFFKYYSMEQYEDTLQKMRYGDSDTLFSAKHPFENYAFLTDEKFSYVLKTSGENNDIAEIDFDALYPDIDFAETTSLAKGLSIKQIKEKSVTLSDGKEYSFDFENMTAEEKVEFIQMLKPFLWWGE